MLSHLYVGGEKKFLSPSVFHILWSHRVWKFHYKAKGRSLTLHIPKPSLSKVNHHNHSVLLNSKHCFYCYSCNFDYEGKRKWDSNYADDWSWSQHNALCSWRATLGKVLGRTEYIASVFPFIYKHKRVLSGHNSSQGKLGSGYKPSSLSFSLLWLLHQA